MSTIKNHGGGSQYTFLEAIYQGCVLVLQREWIKHGSIFKEGINCLAVDTPEELATVLSEPRYITNLILNDIIKSLNFTQLNGYLIFSGCNDISIAFCNSASAFRDSASAFRDSSCSLVYMLGYCIPFNNHSIILSFIDESAFFTIS